MAYHLATSNLSVNSILTFLRAQSGMLLPGAKDIFYIGSSLCSTLQFETRVNKLFLSPTYCPGATPDERLQNLLNTRRLSYFKGYGYDDNVTFSPSYGLTFTSVTMVGKPTTLTYPITSQQVGYSASVPAQTASVVLGGSFPTGSYKISVIINGVERSNTTITGLGTYNITIPTGYGVTYPSTLRIAINSR